MDKIVAAVLLLPSIVFGKAVTLSIGSGWAKPGWTVDLPITLSGGAQPAALQWTFSFLKGHHQRQRRRRTFDQGVRENAELFR